MKIYLASSWRNAAQPAAVEQLREWGHYVYDFRNPAPGIGGFSWNEVGLDRSAPTYNAYARALAHPRACEGFTLDMCALDTCEWCVLLLPCGRSAHLELGFAVGARKRTAIVIGDGAIVPELMYKMVDVIVPTLGDLKRWLVL